MFRFYKIKKGDDLIETSIKTSINIGTFIIKSFKIYKYDTIFSISDCF